ncbi:MAG: bifunctional phosphoribosylaminoimidazolecarboxamide formyltransferase/IMP cyclohydrolase [Defluviitaleaceae bacterium]|nr:bifunctional phosphoribosylaminoimidazolecarboxamide formyltransferase/IMP cyclohydrolase [Defluviitaleaceae bacterium]
MAKRALISVWDKAGVVEFAAGLVSFGYEIISTGSTRKTIMDAGIPATEVAQITGFPECLDGRVKTLHPAIHGGILARRDVAAHMDFLADNTIGTIDIVCVNLYPFKETILKPGATLPEIIENIDIGGPAMIRSAAKNNDAVSVIVDAADYAAVLAELADSGQISAQTRFALAAKAYAHTAAYDALIAQHLGKLAGAPEFPDKLTLTYEKAQDLRYGENPHQQAAFYREIGAAATDLVNAQQLHGKELSFNNINDTHGALELLREFDEPTIVAVKHSTPCGVGCGATLHEAYIKAYQADPVSIFGGIIAANCPVDEATAAEIDKIFVEIVIAPGFTDGALDILRKKKNLRLLQLPNIDQSTPKTGQDFKKVSGGLLIQAADDLLLSEIQCVTDRKPTETEMADLLFAWKLAKHVKSNGIAIGKNGQSLGLAGGQVCRIWAAKQAIDHSHEYFGAEATIGAALASDAFFPFADCVEEAHKAGITTIIQPGGSMNDNLSIETCNKYGIAMVFTGVRHFRH